MEAEAQLPGLAEAVALGLSEAEYRLICELHGSPPNRLELGIYSLLWSEHCAYKHSRRLLDLLPTAGPAVVAGPGENAGVVAFGRDLYCAFKVESHNHPSAVEPFEGAGTGVGGILRDVFALGARPVAVLDSLRFGSPASERARYLLDRAVMGIGRYGNSVGVPTVGGELYFDPAYENNCLINVMAVGLLPGRAPLPSAARGAGNLVVLIGAATGRDGIGGASILASARLGDEAHASRPSVQIADPFEGKKLMECVLELAERGLLLAAQDLGAAGLSSACAEMGAKGSVGIELALERVHLREPLEPFEIMLSESQERMAAVVAPPQLKTVEEVCARHEVPCAAIGRVIEEPVLRVRREGDLLGELPLRALVGGVPRYRLAPCKRPLRAKQRGVVPDGSAERYLLALLGSPNICSRAPLFEQYDFLVGGRTLLAPGQGDAALLDLGAEGALALTVDCNGRRLAEDPYAGAIATVLEGAANLACVGATPLGATDNLNFGDPGRPEVAWQLGEAVRGLAEALRALSIPVVGGNVSLYNDSAAGPILPTPVVGMVGKVEPGTVAPGPGFVKQGAKVALFGPFVPTLRASELETVVGTTLAGRLRVPSLERAAEALAGLREAVARGALTSAHDISEGGLTVALAECCLLGGVGAEIDLRHFLSLCGEEGRWAALFGEGPLGFVVSGSEAELERLAASGPLVYLGEVGGDELALEGPPPFACRLGLEDLQARWRALDPYFS